MEMLMQLMSLIALVLQVPTMRVLSNVHDEQVGGAVVKTTTRMMIMLTALMKAMTMMLRVKKSSRW